MFVELPTSPTAWKFPFGLVPVGSHVDKSAERRPGGKPRGPNSVHIEPDFSGGDHLGYVCDGDQVFKAQDASDVYGPVDLRNTIIARMGKQRISCRHQGDSVDKNRFTGEGLKGSDRDRKPEAMRRIRRVLASLPDEALGDLRDLR